MRISELRKQIPITAVVEHLGGDVRGSGWGWTPVRCPFHRDGSPSASLSNDEGHFRCHDAACGVGGDIVDLAMAHLSTDDIHLAMQWLEETFGTTSHKNSERERDLL